MMADCFVPWYRKSVWGLEVPSSWIAYLLFPDTWKREADEVLVGIIRPGFGA